MLGSRIRGIANPAVRLFCRFARHAATSFLLAVVACVLVLAAAALYSAEPPSAKSWAELTAERERLAKRYHGLVAAGKTIEAMREAEMLVEVDRRIVELKATNADQEKLQEEC